MIQIKELKEYVLEQNYIETILLSLGCHHISHKNGFYQCANPDGDNTSAVCVYENESINVVNYTRNIQTDNSSDLFSLIQYYNECSFFESVKYVCKQCGLDYYTDLTEELPESLSITKLIYDMREDIDTNNDKPLKLINPKILSYYKPYVNDMFYSDNIDYQTQQEFQIGYDESTNRITIPIFSELGDLVGIKGRLFKKELMTNELKYIYLEPCSRARVLYGLNKTLPSIKANEEVYVVEAEKGVLQLWSYGYKNVVATGGKKISATQIEMLSRLGVPIVFAFDKDVDKEELDSIKNRFVDTIPLYYLKDENNILDEKESPTDNPNKWIELLKNKYKL